MQKDRQDKIVSFFKACFFSESFAKTQLAMKMVFVFPTAAWLYFRYFNFTHPLKKAVIVSAFVGPLLNLWSTFTKEIFSKSTQDTPLAGKIRLYSQEASINDINIPYFKNETLRVVNKRKRARRVDDKV